MDRVSEAAPDRAPERLLVEHLHVVPRRDASVGEVAYIRRALKDNASLGEVSYAMKDVFGAYQPAG